MTEASMRYFDDYMNYRMKRKHHGALARSVLNQLELDWSSPLLMSEARRSRERSLSRFDRAWSTPPALRYGSGSADISNSFAYSATTRTRSSTPPPATRVYETTWTQRPFSTYTYDLPSYYTSPTYSYSSPYYSGYGSYGYGGSYGGAYGSGYGSDYWAGSSYLPTTYSTGARYYPRSDYYPLRYYLSYPYSGSIYYPPTNRVWHYYKNM